MRPSQLMLTFVLLLSAAAAWFLVTSDGTRDRVVGAGLLLAAVGNALAARTMSRADRG